MIEESSNVQGADWEERPTATPGGRLRLEPVTREHAVEMAEVLKDPALNEHTKGRPPSIEYLTTRYETLSSRRSPAGDELWFNWVVRLNAEGLAVGYVQATVREGSAVLAWVVGVPWQGAGIATEAAAAMIGILQDRLTVTSFSASIATSNRASQRVAAQLGMRRSGVVDNGEEVWVVGVSADAGRAR